MINSKHKSFIQAIMYLPLCLLLIALDQWSKYWAFNSLKVNGPITVIKNVFSFTWTENTGVAWSILSGSPIHLWLPIIMSVVLIFVFILFPNTKRMLPINICIIALISGAVSNRIDRSVYGAVQDFLYFELINFPIFNIADCYIVISCILVAVLVIFYYNDDEFDGIFSLKKRA